MMMMMTMMTMMTTMMMMMEMNKSDFILYFEKVKLYIQFHSKYFQLLIDIKEIYKSIKFILY